MYGVLLTKNQSYDMNFLAEFENLSLEEIIEELSDLHFHNIMKLLKGI
ncbi:hypothetical protein J2TS4_58160 [Paenibacillus sp. J2TS4]|nr:hypothetical protein J2TS4_58160 [Paenibacillus sp. J2TS4]